MLGPNRTDLIISRELAAGCGGLRGEDCGALFRRQDNGWRGVVGPGELEDDAGDFVLGRGGQAAGGFEGLVQELGHGVIVAGCGGVSMKVMLAMGGMDRWFGGT